jgi:hypothetical protein
MYDWIVESWKVSVSRCWFLLYEQVRWYVRNRVFIFASSQPVLYAIVFYYMRNVLLN